MNVKKDDAIDMTALLKTIVMAPFQARMEAPKEATQAKPKQTADVAAKPK